MNVRRIFAGVAACLLAVAALFTSGFGPDAQPVLACCVDWLTGWTGHTDGAGLAVASLAAAAPAVTTEVKDAAKALAEKLKGLTGSTPGDEDGFGDEDVEKLIDDRLKAVLEDRLPTTAAQFDTGKGAAKGAPALLRHGRGDTEAKALAAFVRDGDRGGVSAVKGAFIGDHEVDLRVLGAEAAVKASNDTDMNITTEADGGYAVPVGHYNRIIARRNERMLATRLGVMTIPGRGTTVNVPVEAGNANAFVETGETVAYDRDAPALGQAAMTLKKYTKKVELTEELLDDEDSALLAFLEDYVSRAAAVTHNGLLVTEVATNGGLLKTTASATALAAGELEDVVYNDTLRHYIDGRADGNWVVRPSTYGKVAQLTGNRRLYVPQEQGRNEPINGENILGFPVHFSNQVAAYGTTTNKFALFGNFAYVGKREGTLSVLRDPYSGAGNGYVRLWYRMRTVYKVLQSQAVGYVAHA